VLAKWQPSHCHVNVAVDDHGSANLVLSLHAAYGYGHGRGSCKSFTVVREGMVEAASDVRATQS